MFVHPQPTTVQPVTGVFAVSACWCVCWCVSFVFRTTTRPCFTPPEGRPCASARTRRGRDTHRSTPTAGRDERHVLRSGRQPWPRSLQRPGLQRGRAAMPRTATRRRSGAGQRGCSVRKLWPLPLQARQVLLPRGLLQHVLPGSPRGAWSRPALSRRLAWRRRCAAGRAAGVWRRCRALPAPRGAVGRGDSCRGCTWQRSACDGGGSGAGCEHGCGRSVGCKSQRTAYLIIVKFWVGSYRHTGCRVRVLSSGKLKATIRHHSPYAA